MIDSYRADFANALSAKERDKAKEPAAKGKEGEEDDEDNEDNEDNNSDDNKDEKLSDGGITSIANTLSSLSVKAALRFNSRSRNVRV